MATKKIKKYLKKEIKKVKLEKNRRLYEKVIPGFVYCLCFVLPSIGLVILYIFEKLGIVDVSTVSVAVEYSFLVLALGMACFAALSNPKVFISVSDEEIKEYAKEKIQKMEKKISLIPNKLEEEIERTISRIEKEYEEWGKYPKKKQNWRIF